ncbi:MAG: nucleotide exchange factor GrpE [Prevotella sp.]|jgi:molecular chaperone GrpE|nr:MULTISPECIES: nucleotide exchange factor GrpE [unclassified Prevotella]MCH3968863.1 nucleotide exchange factor GrpE [Prevotella sp.]MCH3985281.1 nucleotide exchange factor GrpE [Prevotella sp.]MCH3992291.1 nucleotide exchange factor GrpE [Prevotella sp.]MCH4017123.1 nucleotide exchange factor GrpE [Prevotella sp.]MCH4099958.1 nucleotide exchange factor GrpE [Prevotella sp.]
MAEKENEEKKINRQDSESEKKGTPKEETDKKEKKDSQKDEKSEKTDEKSEKVSDKDKEPKEEKKDPLKEAQEQIGQLKDKYLRSVAEFDNYRKRTLKEKADLILNGGEKTITAILPVMDDFERALASKSNEPKAIKDGMNLIYKKFQKALAGLGVKEIDTKDKDFDTTYMEAVAMVPGMGDKKKGKVIDCVQTGYTLNDKVIRHAKVAVGQ